MKSIKEKAEECSLVREYVDSCGNFVRENSRVKQEQFTLGANYVLDAIEEFMTTMNLGNNSAEKFYKLDLMADIHEFIEQLK